MPGTTSAASDTAKPAASNSSTPAASDVAAAAASDMAVAAASDRPLPLAAATASSAVHDEKFGRIRAGSLAGSAALAAPTSMILDCWHRMRQNVSQRSAVQLRGPFGKTSPVNIGIRGVHNGLDVSPEQPLQEVVVGRRTCGRRGHRFEIVRRVSLVGEGREKIRSHTRALPRARARAWVARCGVWSPAVARSSAPIPG